MLADRNPKWADATFRFRVDSGEILDDEGRPTGMTLQDLGAAAEASFVRYLAADPQQQKATSTSERPRPGVQIEDPQQTIVAVD